MDAGAARLLRGARVAGGRGIELGVRGVRAPGCREVVLGIGAKRVILVVTAERRGHIGDLWRSGW